MSRLIRFYLPQQNIFGLDCFFMSQSTAMVMSRQPVHLTTLFILGKLEEAVHQYFAHILSLVTDKIPSGISGREENGGRNYFMINLHESMGPGWNQTRDTWICSQTPICSQAGYRLRYTARSTKYLTVTFNPLYTNSVCSKII